ncbi:hypothetical protein DPMN_161488 [Dreissena polymorpha]|uniref:Uncharacterized protein n=1 Tax=Dreissena polymorpha TaxID=45954 RepID=A0A9D4EPT7_DREPO|nr:hypothetical protein DPMN_161488 [Dreissena polymorpha]
MKILSIPLRRSSTSMKFFATDYRKDRTRMLKPRDIIDTMSDNDTHTYVPGIHEKYAAMPKSLCTIALAEFLEYSDKSYSTSYTTMEEDEVTVDMLSSTVDLPDG